MLKGNSPEVFLDTDVAFDIISKREPHYVSSVKLLHLASKGMAWLAISESSLTTLFYLSLDIYKIENAVSKLSDFIGACASVHGNKGIALTALRSAFKDKEDAFQYYTAVHAKADYFITRNGKDYKHQDPSLPVYTPIEFLKIINAD